MTRMQKKKLYWGRSTFTLLVTAWVLCVSWENTLLYWHVYCR